MMRPHKAASATSSSGHSHRAYFGFDAMETPCLMRSILFADLGGRGGDCSLPVGTCVCCPARDDTCGITKSRARSSDERHLLFRVWGVEGR